MKGNQWYVDMNAHVGADVNSRLVPTVSVTPACQCLGHQPVAAPGA